MRCATPAGRTAFASAARRTARSDTSSTARGPKGMAADELGNIFGGLTGGCEDQPVRRLSAEIREALESRRCCCAARRRSWRPACLSPAPSSFADRKLPPTGSLRFAVNMTTIESAPVFLAAECVRGCGHCCEQRRYSAARQRRSRRGDERRDTGPAQVLRPAPTSAIVLTVAECYYRIVARRSAGISPRRPI